MRLSSVLYTANSWSVPLNLSWLILPQSCLVNYIVIPSWYPTLGGSIPLRRFIQASLILARSGSFSIGFFATFPGADEMTMRLGCFYLLKLWESFVAGIPPHPLLLLGFFEYTTERGISLNFASGHNQRRRDCVSVSPEPWQQNESWFVSHATGSSIFPKIKIIMI